MLLARMPSLLFASGSKVCVDWRQNPVRTAARQLIFSKQLKNETHHRMVFNGQAGSDFCQLHIFGSQIERERVINEVTRVGYIAVGMEQFPAIDEEQLDYIRRIIDESDYYVVIIRGKYGSLVE
jgi:hypothetical protein